MKKISEKKSSKELISRKRTETSGIKKQKFNSIKLSPKKTNGKNPVKKNEVLGIKKQYLQSNGSCNVSFRLPKEAAPDAQNVAIAGDFNNWDSTETLMKKLKSGDFKLTLKLHRDKEYRFRYLIDGKRWENDWCADKYVPNPYGCDDSLVIV
ncbi:MAG: isoamylase early set domain-containing protein [Nitrospirota bacterium]